MNLLVETIKAIQRSGHTKDDIIFIGSEKSGHQCTWEEFTALADVEYAKDYGAQKVAYDLIIVFSDGATMWRGEKDGGEWWAFSEPFRFPTKIKPIHNIITNEVGWNSVKKLNIEEG